MPSSEPDVVTPEGFVAWLEEKKPRPTEFADAVAELTDPQRKKLSKTAQEFYKRVRKGESRDRWFFVPTPLGGMARLGLLAVAPRSAAVAEMNLMQIGSERHRWDIHRTSAYEEAATRILLTRRPDWAQLWFEKQLGSTNGIMISWPAVKVLLEAGVIERSESEEYARFMQGILLSGDLISEPNLIEDLWMQFRFQTGFFNNWEDIDRDTSKPLNWNERHYGGGTLVYNLVAREVIDRGRVFDEILAAFWRDFNNDMRKSLVKLHEALEPTSAELLSRQSEYIRLLQNPTATNVSFAIKLLKSIRKEDGFDTAATLEAIPAAFDHPKKTQPKAALSLLKMLTGKQRESTERSARVVTRALTHSEVDVQEAALKLLEGWAKVFVPTDELRSLRDLVSPVARQRLDTLIGDESADEKVDPAAGSPMDTSELSARIEAVERSLREFWKLDESLRAAVGNRMLPPVSVQTPRPLADLNEVTPVADVYELIDLIAAASEQVEDWTNIERIMDGISRFGHDYPDDFDERVAGIISRYRDESYETNGRGIRGSGFILPNVSRLVLTWMQRGGTQQPKELKQMRVPADVTVRLLNERADRLRQRLSEKKPAAPLLAMPTHEFGWIDPLVFVERLKQQLAIDADPWQHSRLELSIALLRIAPCKSDAARELAGDLPQDIQRFVRYALGEEIEPRKSDKSWAPQWLAAAKCRQPNGDLPPTFSPLEIPSHAYGLKSARIEVLPDLSTPARMRRHEEQQAEAAEATGLAKAIATVADILGATPIIYEKARLPVQLTPRNGKVFSKSRFVPIVLGEYIPRKNVELWQDEIPPWADEWLASFWPANPDVFLAKGLCRLLERLDDKASGWSPNDARIRPLLRPDRDWSEVAMQTIWYAMYSRDADCRAIAIDAMVEGILDGRAHPEPLGDTLVSLFSIPWLKLNRLCDSIKEIARVSRWGTLMLANIVDRAIATWTELPRDAHHLLSVQLELLLEIDGCVSDAARKLLAGAKGSSKTAKLARQLLALSGSPQSAASTSAMLEGVAVRLSRAEASP